MTEFSRSDIAKVMNHADITAGWLPSDAEAREVVRAAVEVGVLTGVCGFHVTDEGDFIVVIERDGFRYVTTGPVSTRYLWRSGLTGAAAVADMLRNTQDEATAARTQVYPGNEGEED